MNAEMDQQGVSLLSMFFINQPLHLQKTKPLYPNPKYLFGIGIWILIWAAKNYGFSHHVSIVCAYTLCPGQKRREKCLKQCWFKFLFLFFLKNAHFSNQLATTRAFKRLLKQFVFKGSLLTATNLAPVWILLS